jgi:hypothetical protein
MSLQTGSMAMSMSGGMGMSSMMDGTMNSAGVAAQKQYDVLIHAISHEHTKDNFDRHVLVLEKWLRDYQNGFFMRDLSYINFIIALLRERIVVQMELFAPIVTSLLKVCGKPLYESKANERLRSHVQDNIRKYYIELARLWEVCDPRTRINIANTFRCIVNGGVDPRILKVDIVPFESYDDRTPMTDKKFIQGLLRDSGVVNTIVGEFLSAVSNMSLYSPDAANILAAPLVAMSAKKQDDDDNNINEMKNSLSNNNSRHGHNGTTEGEVDSDDEMFPNQLSGVGSQVVGSVDVNGNTQVELEGSLVDQSSALMTKGDDDAALAAETGKTYLDLCTELSVDIQTLVMMADCNICMGLTDLLAIASSESIRDDRVSICCDLLWRSLEYRLKVIIQPVMKITGGLNEAKKNLKDLNIINFDIIIPILKILFLRLLFEGYRLADKELRNEIIIILTLLINFPQAIPYIISCDLITTLITYACIGEAGADAWPFFDNYVAKERNFATAFDVDLQLKSSIWMLLQDLMDSCDPDVLLCIGASPMLSVILSYMEVDSSDNRDIAGSFALADKKSLLPYPRQERDMSHIPEFPPIPGNEPMETKIVDKTKVIQYFNVLPISQLRDLQVLGMNFISKNAPLLMGEFLRIDGPLRVLEVIHRYADSTTTEHKLLVYNALLALTTCLQVNHNSKYILIFYNYVI